MAGAKAAVIASIATAIPTASPPSTYSIFFGSFLQVLIISLHFKTTTFKYSKKDLS